MVMLNLGLSTSRIEGSQCNKTQEPAHSLHALSTNSNSHQDIVVTTKFSPTSPFLFVSGTVRTHHTFRLPSIHFITKYYKARRLLDGFSSSPRREKEINLLVKEDIN